MNRETVLARIELECRAASTARTALIGTGSIDAARALLAAYDGPPEVVEAALALIERHAREHQEEENLD